MERTTAEQITARALTEVGLTTAVRKPRTKSGMVATLATARKSLTEMTAQIRAIHDLAISQMKPEGYLGEMTADQAEPTLESIEDAAWQVEHAARAVGKVLTKLR